MTSCLRQLLGNRAAGGGGGAVRALAPRPASMPPSSSRRGPPRAHDQPVTRAPLVGLHAARRGARTSVPTTLHTTPTHHSLQQSSHRRQVIAIMVRRYERTSGRQMWTEEAMSLAVAAVLSGKMGYKMAARTYQIPRSTLQRRASKVRGICVQQTTKATLGNFRRVFTDEQEQDLVGYIKSMEKFLIGVTRRDIRELAFQYAVDNDLAHPFDTNTRMAGEDWVRNFLKRNPDLTMSGDDGELERVNFDQFYHFMSQH